MVCFAPSPTRFLIGTALLAVLLMWRAEVLGDGLDWFTAALALACAEIALADLLRRQRQQRRRSLRE
jgi:hypothetical protein